MFGPSGSPQRALIAGIVKKAGDRRLNKKIHSSLARPSFQSKSGGERLEAVLIPQRRQREDPKALLEPHRTTGRNYWVDAQGNNPMEWHPKWHLPTTLPKKFDLTKVKVTPVAQDAPAKFDLSKV